MSKLYKKGKNALDVTDPNRMQDVLLMNTVHGLVH